MNKLGDAGLSNVQRYITCHETLLLGLYVNHENTLASPHLSAPVIYCMSKVDFAHFPDIHMST